MKLPVIGLAIAVLVASAFGQDRDVKAAWAEIAKVRQEGSQQKLSRADTEKLIAAKARELVTGLDAAKVDAKDADGWAQICEIAGMYPECEVLAQKSVNYHAMVAFQTQTSLLHAYLEQGKFKEFLSSLRYVMAADTSMIGQLGESVGYYASKYAKTNPKLIQDAYDALLSRIDLKHPPVSPADIHFRDYAYVSISVKKFELMSESGHRKEAVAGLKALRAQFVASKSSNAFGQSAVAPIDELLGRWGLVSNAAPKLGFDRTIGGFKGLDALKGKVVLLDFFAHWCGPCKAAFPEIRETYGKYKARGFEVVGVTSYYGYIGSTQNLKPADEFEAMKGFVKDQNMTWPVAFDATKKSFEAFQVGAIPHMVLIDKTGKVRAFYVGYEPARLPDIRAQIEKLLAES